MKLSRRHALAVTVGSLVMSGLSAPALAASAKSAFDTEVDRFLADY